MQDVAASRRLMNAAYLLAVFGLLGGWLGGLNRNADVVPADHHFFPGLRTPTDGLRGIGVGEVFVGVVEVGRAVHHAAGGDDARLGEDERILPVEVVVGHIEQNFLVLAAWQ